MQLLDRQALLLDVADVTLRVTRVEFHRLCENNPEHRLELTAQGELMAMPPVALESSAKNGDLFGAVWQWNRQTKLGRVFDSSGGFTLPNGAIRSADVMWISQAKADILPVDVAFPELVPDFVIELRSSKTDSLAKLQKKMVEYRDNGVRLGWLINPQQKQVECYRLGQAVEILEAPKTLMGEDVLPGFVLDLTDIL